MVSGTRLSFLVFLLSTAFLISVFFVRPAFAVMEDYPSVKLQGLDKSVGRTVTFEARVGSTIEYGSLYIKIRACRKAPPIEQPESAAFLQIWEIPPGEAESRWVFSGWMFASSPALSAMDHALYDIWVLDCTGREEPNEAAQQAESQEEADQTNLPSSSGEAVSPSSNEEPLPSSQNGEELSPSSAPTTTPSLPDPDVGKGVSYDDPNFTAYDLIKKP